MTHPKELVERAFEAMEARTAPAHEMYREMHPQPSEPIATCPLCGSKALVFDFSEKPDDIVTRVVMCEMGEAKSEDDPCPRDALAYSGCPFFMPPDDFYQPTGRQAVRYWNEFASWLLRQRGEA